MKALTVTDASGGTGTVEVVTMPLSGNAEMVVRTVVQLPHGYTSTQTALRLLLTADDRRALAEMLAP